ncbi:MAG: DUF4390 domain-containing protein, partial [Ghiorsea sp.]
GLCLPLNKRNLPNDLIRFSLPIMNWRIFLFSLLLQLFFCLPASYAEAQFSDRPTHIHIEDGVVYCDVQTFQQESYILNVLGGGSPITVFWQFDVLQQREYWLNKPVASIRLGRQVISDLVTKRWLMRDLNSGVVTYTANIQTAMRFLTEMQHAAIMDTSLLAAAAEYVLATRFYLHEGEWEQASWWTSWMDWGEDMGEVPFALVGLSTEAEIEGVDAQ